MAQLFANNAFASLGSSLSSVSTSIVLATGTGSRFPAPTGGDHFLLTLVGIDSNGNENAWEVVRVTTRSADTLTVVRAQEGTTATLWASGTRVELRMTAGSISVKVSGPGSSTDNAIARYDGATGKLIKSSSAALDNDGNLTVNGSVTIATGSFNMPNNSTQRWRGSGGIFNYGSSGAAIGKLNDDKLYVQNFGGDIVFQGTGFADLLVIGAGGNTTFNGNVTQARDYGDFRFRASNLANTNGWRLTHTVNGASTDGYLVIQHSNDNFVANFINALSLGAGGDATLAGSVFFGSSSGLSALVPQDSALAWKNGSANYISGTQGADIVKVSADNALYIQNFDGDTVFRRAGYATTLTLSAAGNATFTGAVTAATSLEVRGAGPQMQLSEQDGAADRKYWRWLLEGGVYRLEVINDAYSAAVMTPFIIDGNGNASLSGANNRVFGSLAVNTTNGAGAPLDVYGSSIFRGDSNGYMLFMPKFGTNPFGADYDRFEIRVPAGEEYAYMGTTHGGTAAPRKLILMAGNTSVVDIAGVGAGSRVKINTNLIVEGESYFAQALAVSAPGSGYMQIAPGSASVSGFVGSYTSAGLRRGYSGYWDGFNYVLGNTDGATDLVIGSNNTARQVITSAGLTAFTNSIGFGYGAGSGGSVTQPTSVSTPVTINKPSGEVFLFRQSWSAGEQRTFQVVNSIVGSRDTVTASVLETGIGADWISIETLVAGAGGSFYVCVRNMTGVSLADAQIGFQFNVIKGSTS